MRIAGKNIIDVLLLLCDGVFVDIQSIIMFSRIVIRTLDLFIFYFSSLCAIVIYTSIS